MFNQLIMYKYSFIYNAVSNTVHFNNKILDNQTIKGPLFITLFKRHVIMFFYLIYQLVKNNKNKNTNKKQK